jgi:hypothetical protein
MPASLHAARRNALQETSLQPEKWTDRFGDIFGDIVICRLVACSIGYPKPTTARSAVRTNCRPLSIRAV